MGEPRRAVATAFAVSPDNVDDWFGEPEEAIGVASASEHLGMSQRALRRRLEQSVRGTNATHVSGECNGKRFIATRARAGRGIAWHFTFADRATDLNQRITDLRSHMVEVRHGSEERERQPRWRRVLSLWRG